MESDADKDLWVKHLQMIQDVITRQANAAAWVKRLCVVVVGGAIAVAGRDGNGAVLLSATWLTIAFWYTDAKYLQQERWFRTQFETVRMRGPKGTPNFQILPDADVRRSHTLIASALSWSTAIYGALVVLLLTSYYLWALCR